MVGFFPLITDSVLHRLGGLPRELYGVTLFESISASAISHEKTNNDFDSLLHLRIAGSAGDITTKHSP